MKRVLVNHALIDQMHFFTSEDEMAKGLLAASRSLELAFYDVGHQLNILWEYNNKIKGADFHPEIPLDQLVDMDKPIVFLNHGNNTKTG